MLIHAHRVEVDRLRKQWLAALRCIVPRPRNKRASVQRAAQAVSAGLHRPRVGHRVRSSAGGIRRAKQGVARRQNHEKNRALTSWCNRAQRVKTVCGDNAAPFCFYTLFSFGFSMSSIQVRPATLRDAKPLPRSTPSLLKRPTKDWCQTSN